MVYEASNVFVLIVVLGGLGWGLGALLGHFIMNYWVPFEGNK